MKRIIFWVLFVPAAAVMLCLSVICHVMNIFIRACMTLCDVLDELDWWSIGMEADEYINNPLKSGNFWQRVVKYWHGNDRPL